MGLCPGASFLSNVFGDCCLCCFRFLSKPVLDIVAENEAFRKKRKAATENFKASDLAPPPPQPSRGCSETMETTRRKNLILGSEWRKTNNSNTKACSRAGVGGGRMAGPCSEKALIQTSWVGGTREGGWKVLLMLQDGGGGLCLALISPTNH